MTINLYTNVAHSPAWQYVTDALNELRDNGLGFEPVEPPYWSDYCLVDMDDCDRVRGFLIYRYQEFRCSWYIMLAWTSPHHRRQGVHTGLFNALVERANLRNDILSIESGTHVDNVQAQKAFAAQGRRQIAISYNYPIRNFVAGTSHLDVTP